MAFRLYFVPKVLVGDELKPKYFGDGAVTASWTGMDYENWYLVGTDMSAGDHATLAAQSDVMVLPTDLSATLTAGQVTTVQAKLDTANIPAGWVTTALTWTQVVRIVCGMIRLTQRFRGTHSAGLLGGGITPNSTVANLSATVQQYLQEAAASLGLDTSSITGGTTIRAALKILGEQLRDQPLRFGVVVI